MPISPDSISNTVQTSPGSFEASIEYRFSGFRVDTRQRRLFNPESQVVNLSARAYDTLVVLLKHHGETLSKSQLMAAVWPNAVVEENNLSQAIFALRRALGDSKTENNFILTVTGRGFCFVAQVEKVSRAATSVSESAQAELDATAVIPTAASASHSVLASTAHAVKLANAPLLAIGVFVLVAITGTVLYLLSKQQFLPPSINNQQAVAEHSSAALAAPALPANTIANSIAVLPFVSLDTKADHQLFTLGLHDEVINQLTKVKSLNVIARNSVLTLVDQHLSTAEIGKRLRVKTMMSGTILFVGEQARISLQLLDADTSVTLWTGSYEANKADLSEMITIQSDIAQHVASALETEIQQSEQQQIATVPTSSFEAYRYNLAARVAHYQQDFGKEWHLAKQAINLDPSYFDALFTFSSVNNVLVATPLPNMTSHDHFQLALQSAERIIEIAPNRSEGYALKAVALSSNKDWAGFAAMVDKLEKMHIPASELKYISLVLMGLGDFNKAIEIYQANLVTEPINLYGRGFLMAALELAGKREQARHEYDIGEELSPVWWGDTVNIFLALGRHEPLRDIDELVGVSTELKTLLLHVDNIEQLRKGLQAYRASPAKISAEAVYYSALAAHIGEQELAVEFMRNALSDVWSGIHWVWLPLFDDMRKQESFRQLLRDSGLVDYWRQHGWPEVCQPAGETFTCEWTAYSDNSAMIKAEK